LVPDGRADEFAEERVGLEGLGLEFGVELDGDEPGMGRVLDHFDEMAVGGEAGEHESIGLEFGAVAVVDFVAVAVALGDLPPCRRPGRRRCRA
jgi:hypothetical protein